MIEMTSAGAPIGALKEYLYVPLPTVLSLLRDTIAEVSKKERWRRSAPPFFCFTFLSLVHPFIEQTSAEAN